MEEKKESSLAAEDRIRETAKWLTVSLALLGGVLVAGTQFSSLGSIEPWGDRFWAALTGGAMAAVGAAAILFGTVWTATTPPVSLDGLEHSNWPHDKFVLELRENVGELRDHYKTALEKRNESIKANLANPTSETALAAKTADVWAVHLANIVQNVLKVASYQSVSSRWKRASRIIAAGATLAFVGLMVFIWGVNPPAVAKASSARAAVVGEVSTQTVQLTLDGQARLAGSLGTSCNASQPLQALYLEQTAVGPDVVILQKGCTPLRIVLTDSWGIVRTSPTAPAGVK